MHLGFVYKEENNKTVPIDRDDHTVLGDEICVWVPDVYENHPTVLIWK